MNEMIFPEDVANVILSFYLCNKGDEAATDLLLAVGAELLDISPDKVLEMITDSFWCEKNDSRIVIKLPNGLKLVAEQNTDPEYQNEFYVGIETQKGVWHQNLAVIRNAYSIDDNLAVNLEPDRFEVLVYADKDSEDYTNKLSIDLRDNEEYGVVEWR